MESPIIAEALYKAYGGVKVVDGINLNIQKGEIYGLLGPNGAGKTTTLEMLEGLRRPDSGCCHVLGYDNQKEIEQIRGKIGVQYQGMQLMEYIKVSELINLYRSFHEKPLTLDSLLNQFSLNDHSNSFVSVLSGGQKQRLALALTLVNDPEVIFLDEPTTGLDPQSRQSLWEKIKTLKGRGRTVLLTTHYLEEAEQLCDRLSIMDHGKLLVEGSPRELIRSYGSESAIEFSGSTEDDLAVLSNLRGVTGIHAEDNRITLLSSNLTNTLIDLAQYAKEQGTNLVDLRTRGGSLEDVFLKLTGRRLRD